MKWLLPAMLVMIMLGCTGCNKYYHVKMKYEMCRGLGYPKSFCFVQEVL